MLSIVTQEVPQSEQSWLSSHGMTANWFDMFKLNINAKILSVMSGHFPAKIIDLSD